MADNVTPISAVPKDYDETKIVWLYNPFTKIHYDTFDSKPVKIPKGLSMQSEPLARMVAKHMAEKELTDPAKAAELAERGKDHNDRSWERVTELSKGVSSDRVRERVAELVLDPDDKKDAKRIKELQAA